MGPIVKSVTSLCLSVCLSVCRVSYTRTMHYVVIVITMSICTCFFIVFLNCYSAMQLPSRKCEITHSAVLTQFGWNFAWYFQTPKVRSSLLEVKIRPFISLFFCNFFTPVMPFQHGKSEHHTNVACGHIVAFDTSKDAARQMLFWLLKNLITPCLSALNPKWKFSVGYLKFGMVK